MLRAFKPIGGSGRVGITSLLTPLDTTEGTSYWNSCPLWICCIRLRGRIIGVTILVVPAASLNGNWRGYLHSNGHRYISLDCVSPLEPPVCKVLTLILASGY